MSIFLVQFILDLPGKNISTRFTNPNLSHQSSPQPRLVVCDFLASIVSTDADLDGTCCAVKETAQGFAQLHVLDQDDMPVEKGSRCIESYHNICDG